MHIGLFLYFYSMLKARGITKKYGTVTVLNGIDLDVQAGTMVTIVGASGAGKTTLLQILGTLENPDAGSLSIGDQVLDGLPAARLAEMRNKLIGFVFQFHNLLPEFTALENVCLPGWIGGQSQTEVEKRGKELLDYLGLSHRLSHRPGQLSGGEQQRTAVARALLNKPKIIFADEPSGNLDARNADELHTLFFNLCRDFGQTFVIVTHNETLANAGHRKVVMENGLILEA
jgi:lipoprotein-releasing system ATP-binding protein